MAPDQVSCPISQRITTIQECKLAARKLSRNYYGDYFVIDRPPGCYYFRAQVYFNKNLEAKPSSVTWFGLGGICKGKERGKELIIIHLSDIELKYCVSLPFSQSMFYYL